MYSGVEGRRRVPKRRPTSERLSNTKHYIGAQGQHQPPMRGLKRIRPGCAVHSTLSAEMWPMPPPIALIVQCRLCADNTAIRSSARLSAVQGSCGIVTECANALAALTLSIRLPRQQLWTATASGVPSPGAVLSTRLTSPTFNTCCNCWTTGTSTCSSTGL